MNKLYIYIVFCCSFIGAELHAQVHVSKILDNTTFISPGAINVHVQPMVLDQYQTADFHLRRLKNVRKKQVSDSTTIKQLDYEIAILKTLRKEWLTLLTHIQKSEELEKKLATEDCYEAETNQGMVVVDSLDLTKQLVTGDIEFEISFLAEKNEGQKGITKKDEKVEVVEIPTFISFLNPLGDEVSMGSCPAGFEYNEARFSCVGNAKFQLGEKEYPIYSIRHKSTGKPLQIVKLKTCE